MPYIPLEDHLPGITGLLEYRKDTAAPIRELTQFLLRGPSSLTEGEPEQGLKLERPKDYARSVDL